MNHTDPNTPPLALTAADDTRLAAALAHAPQPRIPAAFAAQVAARAASLPVRRRARFTQFGPALAWAAMVLLPVALFALAPHAAPRFTSYRFDAELLLLAELAVIGCGLTRRSGTRFTP